MTAQRVLLVEDEFLIRLTLAEALADEGFEVLEAESGDAALALLREAEGVVLLVTDIRLPGGLDGRQLAAAARLQVPELPVIFTSGGLDQRQAADRVGGVSFVAKPYVPSDICAAARRLLKS